MSAETETNPEFRLEKKLRNVFNKDWRIYLLWFIGFAVFVLVLNWNLIVGLLLLLPLIFLGIGGLIDDSENHNNMDYNQARTQRARQKY